MRLSVSLFGISQYFMLEEEKKSITRNLFYEKDAFNNFHFEISKHFFVYTRDFSYFD